MLSNTPYRLELLPVIPPYHRRARWNRVQKGELVYYGPMPTYYGIGEVVRVVDRFVVVDFRGTGVFGIHTESFESQYVIPLPSSRIPFL